MSDERLALPEAPQPPGDGECCGNGCEQCVWVIYQAELNAYRLAQAGRQAAAEGRGQQSGN